MKVVRCQLTLSYDIHVEQMLSHYMTETLVQILLFNIYNCTLANPYLLIQQHLGDAKSLLDKSESADL